MSNEPALIITASDLPRKVGLPCLELHAKNFQPIWPSKLDQESSFVRTEHVKCALQDLDVF